MAGAGKLIKAFRDLAKKYPEAAKELSREFAAAIGMAKAKATLGRNEEVHVIAVKGLGRDGREYVAEFDAVFPRGTKILWVNEHKVKA
jgi:hypothetical protein